MPGQVIFGGLGLIWLITLAIAGDSNKGSPVPPGVMPDPISQVVPQAAPQQVQEPVAMAVDAKEIVGAYENNELKADSVYKGKLVRVAGVADDVKKDIWGSPYITVGSGKRFEVRHVQCTFARDADTSEVMNVSKGDSVTIEGKVKGLMMNVLLEECRIVQ